MRDHFHKRSREEKRMWGITRYNTAIMGDPMVTRLRLIFIDRQIHRLIIVSNFFVFLLF